MFNTFFFNIYLIYFLMRFKLFFLYYIIEKFLKLMFWEYKLEIIKNFVINIPVVYICCIELLYVF